MLLEHALVQLSPSQCCTEETNPGVLAELCELVCDFIKDEEGNWWFIQVTVAVAAAAE